MLNQLCCILKKHVTCWLPLPNKKPTSQHLLPGVFPLVSFNTGGKGSKRQGVAMRFDLVPTKIGLVSLLSKYKFGPYEKTEIPIVLLPKSVILGSTDEIWLKRMLCAQHDETIGH
uniref:Uncharacterized protein n=1 Tax=Timema douglasi TaxID=61478 RepID=A0A7R8VCZ7_TIMDO|nr:unnamed protein product [Timema douglasi]